jgi:hypothetical protein
MTSLFPLKVTKDDGEMIQPWRNFADMIGAHPSLQAICGKHPREEIEDMLFKQYLAGYQAHTNVGDWDDPVWFESQEEMMRFLLEWS